MATVMMIPATVKRRSGRKTEEAPKTRVAAYCRVSTDTDEQVTSYEAQIEHYTDYISKNPDWELAGIYADDGISGINTKKREEFNRLIDDCMAGKDRYGGHEVNQPFCPEHPRLPEVHPATEGQEHPGLF